MSRRSDTEPCDSTTASGGLTGAAPMAPSLLRSTPKRVSAPASVLVSYFCSAVNWPASLRVQPYWPLLLESRTRSLPDESRAAASSVAPPRVSGTGPFQ